jgi:hypothetical protein
MRGVRLVVEFNEDDLRSLAGPPRPTVRHAKPRTRTRRRPPSGWLVICWVTPATSSTLPWPTTARSSARRV